MYEIVTIPEGFSLQDIEDWLNDLSMNGYEVVTIFRRNDVTYLLLRL